MGFASGCPRQIVGSEPRRRALPRRQRKRRSRRSPEPRPMPAPFPTWWIPSDRPVCASSPPNASCRQRSISGTMTGLKDMARRPSAMRRLRLEMMQRQRRPGFQRLDRDIAAHFSDDRQVEQSLDKESLIVLQVRYDHLQQVIGFPGNEMTGNDLRQSHDGFLEDHRSIIGVTIDLDPDEYGKAETNPVALQCRAVGFDIAVLFKSPNAPQAGRCRQADLLGQFDITQPAVGL